MGEHEDVLLKTYDLHIDPQYTQFVSSRIRRKSARPPINSGRHWSMGLTHMDQALNDHFIQQ